VAQQNGSEPQTCEAHGSHDEVSAPPVEQMGCEQPPPPASGGGGGGAVQLSPQIEPTSLTQMLSHCVAQQNGS